MTDGFEDLKLLRVFYPEAGPVVDQRAVGEADFVVKESYLHLVVLNCGV